MYLTELPPELIVHVLSYLDAASLGACEETCTLFHALTQSPTIQYRIACDVASVIDNPSGPLDSTSDRLRLLRKREDAYARTRPSWKRQISVPFVAAGLYELTGGQFWLGEQSRKALQWISLPIYPHETPIWRRLQPVGEEENSVIVDFGLAVEEHDLVLVAKYSWTGLNSTSGFVSLHPYCISNAQPHPLAKGPIEVINSHNGQPRVTIEIVGDLAVFLTGFSQFGANPPSNLNQIEPDRLYVYEWKTGTLRKQMTVRPGTYSGAAFITPEILMLPNASDASLELWDISASGSDWDRPLLTLKLPYIQPNANARYISTRCEPNPAVYSSKGSASRFPFSPDSADAIAVFHITYTINNPVTNSASFLLFMHRRSFLQLLDKHVTRGPRLAVSGPVGLPYNAWGGPRRCRWLPARDVVTDWITTTAGQRAVILGVGSPDGGPVYMFDFNVRPEHLEQRNYIDEPYEVAARASLQPRLTRNWKDFPASADIGGEMRRIFAQPVGSELPAYFCHIRPPYRAQAEHGMEVDSDKPVLEPLLYTGASLDEARIVGLKRDSLHHISAVDILFFG